MALSNTAFQSFYNDIHNFWSSMPSSNKCTEKELIHILISAALRQTGLDIREALIGVLYKQDIDMFVNSWKERISVEELPWLFMYSLQEADGLNPIIIGFDETLIHHLSSRKDIRALRCSFISSRLITFAQDNRIKLVPVIEKLVYISSEDILVQSLPSYNLMLSCDWAPKRKGVVLSSIYNCDDISLEAGSFICQNGNYILFDTEECCDGTLMSDLSDGWHMIVPYGNVFTRNISTIRNYFSNGCLRPVECGICHIGQEELFLDWSDFRPAISCDYQIDTSESNMSTAQEGDRYLDRPAIIVNLDNLEVYVHTSRLRLGIPEDIFERSVILVPDYVDNVFCRSSLMWTANDLYNIFNKREEGFEGFTRHYRKFWIEKARTGKYCMNNPIASIKSFINDSGRGKEFETRMWTLAKIPMKAHNGLDRECAGIRYNIQEEYGIDTNNNNDLSALNEAWSQFWTIDQAKLQKGRENYNNSKFKLPSIIVLDKIQRGEWPTDINPIEDLALFIDKENGKRDEFIYLMRDIQRIYKERAKTMPKDRAKIIIAVNKHFGIEDNKKAIEIAGKDFGEYWNGYRMRVWNKFWGITKEDNPDTDAVTKNELDYDYLIERIGNGEWIR